MIEGTKLIENFIADPRKLYDLLRETVTWDERMHARKTASFGVAYNYSQMSYPFQQFTPELLKVIEQVSAVVGFTPNNCLINYYLDGKSKMGFHSDQTDILADNTGVAIVSLGEPRVLRFRNIADYETRHDVLLTSGSLFYMTAEVQHEWQHAIPKSQTDNGRMSLTLRQLIG